VADALLAAGGFALVCCGLAVASRGRVRLALWLLLAGGGDFAGRAVVDREWRGVAAVLCTTALITWLLWRSRRQGDG
jgi:hypothetical protein